jgi:hypothetical protein
MLSASTLVLCAQEKLSYQIVSHEGVSDLEPYRFALNNTDLDAWRLHESPRTIFFDSGVEVILLSAQQLEEQFGRTRDERFVQRKGSEPVYPWYLTLDPHGKIQDKRIAPVTGN